MILSTYIHGKQIHLHKDNGISQDKKYLMYRKDIVITKLTAN